MNLWTNLLGADISKHYTVYPSNRNSRKQVDRATPPNSVDETAELFSDEEEEDTRDSENVNADIESGSDGELGSKQGEEEDEEEEEEEERSDESRRSPTTLDDSCLKRPNPFKVLQQQSNY